MSETKWTKGPWVVFTPEDYDGPRQLPGLGVESVSGEAVVWYCDRPETGLGNDSDAHLIAAAPELLAACEAAEWNSLDLPDFVVKQLRDAIAKARGEA